MLKARRRKKWKEVNREEKIYSSKTNNQTNKQKTKQNNNEKTKERKKEKKMGNWFGIEPRTSCLVWLIPTTTLLRMTIYIPKKVFNLMPFSWNFCLQTLFKADWAVLNTNLFKDILRGNKALTGEILVFWTGSCLLQVVAYQRWLRMKVWLYYVDWGCSLLRVSVLWGNIKIIIIF